MKKSLDHLAVRPHPLSGLVSAADYRESESAPKGGSRVRSFRAS